MSWYEFLLFVHVVAAVAWLGGALATQFYAALALRSPEPARRAGIGADIAWVGLRVFTTSSLVLIVSAVLLMIESSFDWGRLWVVWALLVWGFSFVVGAGFLGPESGRIGALIAAEGPGSPEAARRLARIIVLSRIELVLLFSVVFAMTVKPTSDDAWTVVLGALAVVLAVAAVVAAARRGAAPEAQAA